MAAEVLLPPGMVTVLLRRLGQVQHRPGSSASMSAAGIASEEFAVRRLYCPGGGR